MNSYPHMNVNERGQLSIDGVQALDLAHRFGTPLYVLSEKAIRERCQDYQRALAGNWKDAAVAYAGKALLPLAICRIMSEENMWLDVASGGELYVALKSGFPAERILYHGNNKSPEEIRMGLETGVGRFVLDNFEELETLAHLAHSYDQPVSVLLRITPGVDTATHRYISTGHKDSKFGFHLASGEALEATRKALNASHLRLTGFHCHLGSQLVELDSLLSGVEVMAEFMATIRQETLFVASELNLGGGLGIAYTEQDHPPTVDHFVGRLTGALRNALDRHELDAPRLFVEPGRSIVGEAGLTLYTVGSIKRITPELTYVLVDGGMADNPRPALYEAQHQAVLCDRVGAPRTETVQIAGKCCESGDVLLRNARMAQARSGDILAVFCTGAYNHSMSSNYNRLQRPAMVLVNDGQADLIVARESYAHLIRNEMVPGRLSSEQATMAASL